MKDQVKKVFMHNGCRASTLHLPPGNWTTVLECLCSHFPVISKKIWIARFNEGLILDADGHSLAKNHPYRQNLRIHYFREVEDESPIPFDEKIIYRDDHLLITDKPHFLPVMPAGRYVKETLQNRLARRFPSLDMSPLHRIDRHTAGLVMFSCNARSRGVYQQMFREKRIIKHYQAIAPALTDRTFPFLHRSCLKAGDPFFRMEEVEGESNSETRLDVLERRETFWRYALSPITGKKHQLRVHMAGLGAPICNDPFYPTLLDDGVDDYNKPLKLLANRIVFTDPLTGRRHDFESGLSLDWPVTH